LSANANVSLAPLECIARLKDSQQSVEFVRQVLFPWAMPPLPAVRPVYRASTAASRGCRRLLVIAPLRRFHRAVLGMNRAPLVRPALPVLLQGLHRALLVRQDTRHLQAALRVKRWSTLPLF